MVTKLVPFASAESAVPDPELRAAARVDPYWAEMWSSEYGGIAVTWTSQRSAWRREEAGLQRRTAVETRWTRKEALDLLLSRQRRSRLGLLAAILMWRTLTLEQAAAVTGTAKITARMNRTRELLWAAGVVHKGKLAAVEGSRRPGQVSPGNLLRPGESNALDDLYQKLTYVEWLGVTGAQPMTVGATYNRHNVLATELSLRVAEFCPIGTVLGEPFGNWRLVTWPHPSLPDTFKRYADAVWIRPDGLRIAVEVTARTGDSFKGRAAKWAEALAADRTKSTVVLFVEVDMRTQNRSNQSDATARLIRRDIEAATSTADSLMNGVGERMAVARWSQWFPEHGRMNPGFIGLSAERPTGRGNSRWEPVNLLDPFEVNHPRAGLPDRTAVLDNADLLYGVPYWLRKTPKVNPMGVFRARKGIPTAEEIRQLASAS